MKNVWSAGTIPGFLLKSFALIVILLFAYTDFALPGVIAVSDYTTSFYASSRLIVEKRIAELYPKPTDTELKGTAYDKAAHQMLPELPKFMVAIFPYSPVVGLLLSPLALLSPSAALFAFQVVCLIALAAACFMLKRPLLFFTAFLFTPMVLTMWIGQLGVLLAVLPYAAGYWLIRKNRPLAAGIVWSLTFLKPQFAIVPALVCLVWLCRKRWQLSAGVALGASVLLVAPVLIFGVEIFKAWLGAMKLTEAVYLSPTAGVARHLAVSFPRFILFSVPYEQLATFRPIVYALSAVILGLAVFASCWLMRKVELDKATDYAIVIGSLAIPLVAPHLFYYDLCVLFVAGVLTTRVKLRNVLWVIISLYPLGLLLTKSMYLPLLLLVPIAAAFCVCLKPVQLHSDFPGV